MARKLDGKTAVVTGGSRGLGRAIARRLAADGALVAVHYGSNRAAADEAVALIARDGGQAFAVGGDVSMIAGIDDLYAQVDAALTGRGAPARFDILVNNAGIAPGVAFADTSESDFDRVFDINVRGLFFVTQRALSRLNDGGRIINISSGVTRAVFADLTVYAATKGAVNTITLHLAQFLGPRQITVNSLAPGAIDTDMNAEWIRSPEGREMVSKAASLGRVGMPEDIADAAAFLASSDSRWITGQYIEASGGWHL